MVSITPNDYPIFSWGNEGDVTDILITDIFATEATSEVVKVLSGSNGATKLNTKRITIRNISGTLTSASLTGISLGDDNAQPNTSGGIIDEILIDGVQLTYPDGTSKHVILIQGDSTGIQPINRLTVRNVGLSTDCLSVLQVYKHTVKNLIMDGISGYSTTTPILAILYLNGSGATVNRLLASNWNITNAGSVVSNETGEGIRAVSSGVVLTEVFMNNIYMYNTAQIIDIVTSTTLRLSNVHLASNGHTVKTKTGAALIIANASGFKADVITPAYVAGTIESLSEEFPLDTSQSYVVTNLNNKCYNTYTGGGLPAGPAIYDGTAWRTRTPVASSAIPIAPSSTAPTAGTATEWARADHKHPRNEFGPADHNLIAWSFDPAINGTGTALGTAGTLYVIKLHVPVATSVTSIYYQVTVAGGTLTSGQNFAAIYQAGALVGVTADQTTNFGGTGGKIAALVGGPIAVAAGDIYVAFWFNGTTGPSLQRGIGFANQNVGLAASASRFGTANTGQTTTPPGTLGTVAAASIAYWVAIG